MEWWRQLRNEERHIIGVEKMVEEDVTAGK
jgi:hypothetical protein